MNIPVLARTTGAALVALACAAAASDRGAPPIAETDRAAIRALDAKFVRAWLDDDAEGVLRLFAPDAVLLPPNAAPQTGLASIRAFWWPRDGSRTRITRFDRTIDEVEGSGDFAWLRGSAVLAWTYEKDGTSTSQTSRSVDLVLLRRDRAGEWRIVRQIWNTPPQ